MTITTVLVWQVTITCIVIDLILYRMKQRKLDEIQKFTIIELTKELIKTRKEQE
jgi:hypothetical protein